MPSSVTSVFSEAKDFAVAMREEGCLALVGDSTNAVRDGRSPSESDVAKTLGDLIRTAPALLVTGSGQFRARLTQVALLGLRLSATDEQLPRIALVAVPADTILVSLPRGKGPGPLRAGPRIA